VKTEIRKNLFYKKYLYRASFIFPNARYISFCKTIEAFSKLSLKYVFEDINLVRVGNFIEFYHNKNENICRIENKYVSIFGNDLEKLKEICSKITDYFELTKAVVYNCIVLKNIPKFNYRVYFKQKWVSPNDLKLLKEFLDHNVIDKPNMNINRSLKSLLYSCKISGLSYNSYLNGSHHIDYNDESFLTIVYLWLDKFVGKNYKLVWIGEKDKYSNTMECLDGKSN
jgi:hypothetical protein